jgi:hypothetical protein
MRDRIPDRAVEAEPRSKIPAGSDCILVERARKLRQRTRQNNTGQEARDEDLEDPVGDHHCFLVCRRWRAGPRQNKYRHDPTAGYTFYTSHGSVVGAKPVHNWQTYDDSCDLPSEGCDDNHRLGIGG